MKAINLRVVKMRVNLFKKHLFPLKHQMYVPNVEYLKSLYSILLNLKNKNFFVSLHYKVEKYYFEKTKQFSTFYT